MLITPENYREEILNFPNGMFIKIDYGVMDYDFKDPFISGFERFVGSFRRSRLLFNDELITENIEINPDYVSLEDEEKLIKKGLRIGDVFDRTMNFQDGKVVKIEYWLTIEKRDKHVGMYDATYRKIILFDESGEIISELMEHNPNYLPRGTKTSDYLNDNDDEFLD